MTRSKATDAGRSLKCLLWVPNARGVPFVSHLWKTLIYKSKKPKEPQAG